MASENDHQIDDDVMLQLALSMSLQHPQSPPSNSPEATGATEVGVTPTKTEEVAGSTAETSSEAAVSAPTEKAESSAASEPTGQAVGTSEAKAADTSPKKKKKKKNTYAAMMADVMKPKLSEDEKREQFESKLKGQVGGGEFSKLDKI